MTGTETQTFMVSHKSSLAKLLIFSSKLCGIGYFIFSVFWSYRDLKSLLMCFSIRNSLNANTFIKDLFLLGSEKL